MYSHWITSNLGDLVACPSAPLAALGMNGSFSHRTSFLCVVCVYSEEFLIYFWVIANNSEWHFVNLGILHRIDILNFKVDTLFCFEVCCFLIYLKLVKIFLFSYVSSLLFLSR